MYINSNPAYIQRPQATSQGGGDHDPSYEVVQPATNNHMRAPRSHVTAANSHVTSSHGDVMSSLVSQHYEVQEVNQVSPANVQDYEIPKNMGADTAAENRHDYSHLEHK